MHKYRVRLELIVDKDVQATSPGDAITTAKAILRYVLGHQVTNLESTLAIDVRQLDGLYDYRPEFVAVIQQ